MNIQNLYIWKYAHQSPSSIAQSTEWSWNTPWPGSPNALYLLLQSSGGKHMHVMILFSEWISDPLHVKKHIFGEGECVPKFDR